MFIYWLNNLGMGGGVADADGFHAYIDARGTTLVGEAFLPRETTLATLASDPFAVDRRSTTLVPGHDPFGVNPRGTTIVSP